MTLHTVCRTDELKTGQMKAFTVADQKIVVYHLDDGFYATQASCTHLFAPLAKGKILMNDIITDAAFDQTLQKPAEFDVLATTNLNGDYLSDALAAQVGGIGIAPGANLSDSVAMFEATHGTAPKYAGKDYVNPGSEILSAEMMLVHMGWKEAAALIISSLEKAIADKVVTYDFARLMPGATQVSCSGFGQAMIERM